MFVEKLANKKVYTTNIEVCSSYKLIYDGVECSSNEYIDMSDNTINVISNCKDKPKDTKKIINVDTNTYENIIYNKKYIAIKLFNELDNIILGINSNIKRNYLIKTVAYKFNKKIIKIQIKQNELLVSFHNDIKQFDNQNKLSIRKGYENSSLCYYFVVDEIEILKYIANLCDYYNKCYFYN